MKSLLVMCLLSCALEANCTVICTEHVEESFRFDQSDDGVEGRFVLKWCIPVDSIISKWAVHLVYNKQKCDVDNTYAHSYFEENVEINSSCTNVCFTTPLDLIFNACYYIQLTTSGNGIVKSHKKTTNVTSHPQEYFTQNSTADFKYQRDSNEVVVTWFLQRIPAYNYHAVLELNPNSTDTEEPIAMQCRALNRQQTLVQCRARAPPRYCVAAITHYAPWTYADYGFKSFYHDFCADSARRTAPPGPGGARGGGALWWALGGLLLAALLAPALLLLRHRALVDKLRRRVWEHWPTLLHRIRSDAGGAPGVIVVLYFRECAALRRAGELLCALLAAAGCEAVDLYSAQSVAAAAPAGGAWLRALLLRGDARVLLLQSPAAALHAARLAADEDAAPQLQAPLLAGRAAWRQPHPADALLTLALRLLADGSLQDALPYKKYYVASVAGVQHGDVVPALTPQRRYLLPAAADVLLKDLGVEALEGEAARLLQQFSEALDEYRRYALAEPGYLANNLMFE